MDRLNPQQEAAVLHTDTPLLVLAGAGSGKTRVITRKIARLVKKDVFAPEHIAAITFTNKAAREMAQRLASGMHRDAVKRLRVCTFHRLGMDILNREARLLGLRSGFTILDPDDSLMLLKEIISEQDEQLASWAPRLREQISTWKNEALGPSDVSRRAESDGEARMADWYARYEAYLLACNAVDLDDLVWRCVQLFREHDDALGRWRGRIRYLLVDEYQDTNGAQYELVRLLAGSRGRLTVVGDDDQSIYAWRGARPDNLVRLQRDFPELRIIKLEQNYRSTGCILRSANQLISGNEHIFEKKLWSELGRGELIRIFSCEDDEREAERVAAEILSGRRMRGGKFGDYAVLYRGNHQSRPVELALQRLSIPYRVSGGSSFFSRGEVRDIIAYLRLLANPDDDAAFLRVVNTPRREIGPGSIEKLAGYARERRRPLLRCVNEHGLDARLSARACGRLRAFCDWLDETRMHAAQQELLQVLRGMVEEIQYEAWLFQQFGARGVDFRMNNIEALWDSIGRMLEKNPDADLQQVVSSLALQDFLDRQSDELEDDCVQLCTLHAAKGLEFPHVFMVGMEEGLLPHRSSIELDDVSEERRLAYVGVTRAQRSLTISYAERRKVQGKHISTSPSRFLDELPVEELTWPEQDEDQRSLRERRDDGRSRLGAMRAMLDS